MKSFAEFNEDRIVAQIVEGLQCGTITADAFAECLDSCKRCDETVLYNEFLGGLSHLASSGARGIGRGFAAGGRAIGNAAAATGRGIGNAATTVGRGIGNAATAAGQGIGNAATATGRGIGNVYQQGENKAVVGRAVKNVQELQSFFRDSGGKMSDELKNFLDRLLMTLTNQLERTGQDSSLRMGQKGFWQNVQTP